MRNVSRTAVYDLMVFGAAGAGCVLVARIAEQGVHPRTGERLRVALVEAGPCRSVFSGRSSLNLTRTGRAQYLEVILAGEQPLDPEGRLMLRKCATSSGHASSEFTT